MVDDAAFEVIADKLLSQSLEEICVFAGLTAARVWSVSHPAARWEGVETELWSARHPSRNRSELSITSEPNACRNFR